MASNNSSGAVKGVFSQRELRELNFEISARYFNYEPAPRLTLAVVHPWRINAYWHITPAMMECALAVSKAPHSLVIRFIDVTPRGGGMTSGESTFDVEVDGLSNNWYVDLWQPGRRYAAELGLRGADRGLHVFVRSNEIQVPSAEASPTLDFNLGQYKGPRPLSRQTPVSESNHSVARLANLLPPFSRFPDVRSDTDSEIAAEPVFPSAALSRAESEAEDSVALATYGAEFPSVYIEDADEGPGVQEGGGLPIDLAALPELPQIDPRTVSEGDAILSVTPMPAVLAEAGAAHENAQHAADEKVVDPGAQDTAFPEVFADIRNLQRDSTASFLSGVGDRYAQGYTPDVLASHGEESGEPGDPAGMDANVLDAYRWQGEQDSVHGDCVAGLESAKVPLDAYVADGDLSENVLASRISHQGYASTKSAPGPVIALEEAIADTLFSATPENQGLDLSIHLELSGKSTGGQVLTLFHEAVQLDDQGRFSVRIKLEKGPQLAALLRAQHNRFPEGH